jgi:hypothetical protein
VADKLGLFVTGCIVIAIIYMFVRPGSTGPDIVTQVSDALTDLVKASTGYGNLST